MDFDNHGNLRLTNYVLHVAFSSRAVLMIYVYIYRLSQSIREHIRSGWLCR